MKDLSEPFSAREIRAALYEYVVWLLYQSHADWTSIQKEILTVKKVLDEVDRRIEEEESHGGAREE